MVSLLGGTVHRLPLRASRRSSFVKRRTAASSNGGATDVLHRHRRSHLSRWPRKSLAVQPKRWPVSSLQPSSRSSPRPTCSLTASLLRQQTSSPRLPSGSGVIVAQHVRPRTVHGDSVDAMAHFGVGSGMSCDPEGILSRSPVRSNSASTSRCPSTATRFSRRAAAPAKASIVGIDLRDGPHGMP